MATALKKNTRGHKHSFKRFGLGKERELFLENFSMLLVSGMPVLDALVAIRDETRSRTLATIIRAIADDIENGFPLSAALERTAFLSPHSISLIRLGERSGRLSENLSIVATEQRKERILRGKIRSASMYPVFVLGLTVIIGIGISWFILPKLALVFDQLHAHMPLITRILIGVGIFLNEYGSVAIPASLGVLGVIFFFFFFYPRTKGIGEAIFFSIPGVRKLLRDTEIARFGYLLGTLLEAGLTPTEALDSLSEATSSIRYRRFYIYLRDSITSGNSFKQSFAEYEKAKRLFPITVQQLIVSSEQSGALSTTLLKIGETYETQTDAMAKDLTVILEPILLVIVWLGVVAVALAVILPIYSLVGNIQTPT